MPASARNNFHGRINDLLRHYEELLLAVHNKTRQASLENILSEQTAMSLGVYWEAFVHDVMVAYVVKSPRNCLANLKTRVSQSVDTKFALPARWMKLSLPLSLSTAQVERIIDPKGWNIGASSSRDLRDKANQYLHSSDAIHFSLGAADVEFIDLMVALRNYLAHRSTGSRLTLKSAIAKTTNTALQGPFTSSGAYLKAPLLNSESERRIHELGRQLINVSGKLVP